MSSHSVLPRAAEGVHLQEGSGLEHMNGNGVVDHHMQGIRQSFAQLLQDRLYQGDTKVVSDGISKKDATAFFKSVRRVITDGDGTIFPAGSTQMDPGLADKIHRLRTFDGMETVVNTGKPMSEVIALLNSIGEDVHMPVICEKGAYIVQRDDHGHIRTRYLLSSRELVKDVDRIRRSFESMNGCRDVLEKKYGVKIRRAGDGGHKSLMSIDILQHDAPVNDPNFRNNDYKVLDTHTLSPLKEELKEFLESFGERFNDWRVTDLGNGNLEMHHPDLSKGKATSELVRDGEQTLVLADSGNDNEMAAHSSLPNVSTGVVFHESTPHELVDYAQYGTVGEATGVRYFDILLKAKGIPEGVFVVTNTPPFGNFNPKKGKLDVKIGMPVAIAELVAAIDECKWIYVGDDDFNAHQQTHQLGLNGKLVPVSVSPEDKIGHYLKTSNQELWPLFHKPHAKAPVQAYGQDEAESNLRSYNKVCEQMGDSLHMQVSNFHAKPEHKNSTATVWVHDYQMLKVAKHFKSKEKTGESTIGMFWHIPFPPVEVMLEELPENRVHDIIESLSHHDLIGFHTEEYASNYRAACEYFGITLNRTLVQPISVEHTEIREHAESALRNDHVFIDSELNSLYTNHRPESSEALPETEDADISSIRAQQRMDLDIILCGVERCDDTKACIDRLEIWLAISREHPELFKGKRILEVLVRSREGIPVYDELYQRIAPLVAEINKNVGFEAVFHVPRINDREDVIAAMAKAKILIATPRRDGQNMVLPEGTVVSIVRADNGLEPLQILMTEEVGYYAALKSMGLQDAIAHMLFAEIRRGLEQALRGDLKHVDTEKARVFFNHHNLEQWKKRNIAGMLDVSLENNFEDARQDQALAI